MLGYVQIYKPDLKVREYEIYQGYYCGICKYIGRQYGQLPRMSLSYDAAFLACLLECVRDIPDEPSREHCVVHHIKKKTIIRNDAIEYAGDVMLILAWFKLLDDAHDEGKASAKAIMVLLRNIYRKLQKKHPALCSGIEKNLAELSRLEDAKCESLDEASEAFARIMSMIFAEGADPGHRETFSNIGYHLGKWIYLADAFDDIEENIESGAYNPLLFRFAFADETAEEFRNRIRETVEFNMYHYLAVIADETGSLDIKKNKGIIENIIYFGLNRKTEEILSGHKKERED